MRVLLILIGLILFAAGPAFAQDAAGAPPSGPSQQQLDAAQLDQLAAPIALYPDPLLAQVLMASTYPLEIVQADRFAKANKGLQGDKLTEALAQQDWDTSVKALVEAPTVLAMMNDDLDWTQKLGDAVLAQQADLMDAIQRLRATAQANGKLESTEEQKVTVTQEANQQPVIVIEPSQPEKVYVPYYDPSVVYGDWPYPSYPPYYFPPQPGYIVGGALATGLAWGAGIAIGNAIWDGFDWHDDNIRVDIDRNANFNRNINVNNVKAGNWEHNSYHRRGVNYTNQSVKNKFAKADIKAGDRKLDFRGHGGEQVLRPDGRPGDKLPDRRPDAGNRDKLPDRRPDAGKRPGDRPDVGQLQRELKDRDGPGRQAALDGKKPNIAKRPDHPRPKTNAFDGRDGAKARDFSKRGHASLGNRGSSNFSRPSGGGAKAHRGGPRGGGGRGGGRRR
jgi:Protein of unknown function (DUF3300)